MDGCRAVGGGWGGVVEGLAMLPCGKRKACSSGITLRRLPSPNTSCQIEEGGEGQTGQGHR